MAKTIVGLFDTFAHAESAVDDLVKAGFSREGISVVANDATGEFRTQHEGVNVSQGAGDAVKGVFRGGIYGGLTALAATFAVALIPGIGPIAAFGPMAMILGAAGVGAAAGGIIGGMTGLGVPEQDAGYYAEGVRRGGTLITVQTDDDREREATDILNRHHPADMKIRSEYYRSTGFTNYDAQLPAYTTDQIAADRANYNSYATPTIPTGNLSAPGNTMERLEPVSDNGWRQESGVEELDRDDESVYATTGGTTPAGRI